MLTVKNIILGELRHVFGQNSHRKWNSDGEKQKFGRVEALFRSKQSQKVEF
jgi:hypothetical protein